MKPAVRPAAWTSSRRAGAMLALLLCVLLPSRSASSESASESYRQTVIAIQSRIQSGDLDGAKTLLHSALQHFPEDGGLENLLGIVEIQQGHADKARQAFAAAVKHNPKFIGAYLNLGRLNMETGAGHPADRAHALHAYESVLRMEPHNAEANYQAATLLMWSGQYERSRQHLARLGPQDREQAGALGIACVDEAALGHRKEAESAAAKLIANPGLNEQLAIILLPGLKAARRADLIERIYAAIDKNDGLSAAGLRVLGLAQEANGELKQARATLERCYAKDPTSVVPLKDLARVAEESDDDRGALGYLAHARVLAPKDPSLPFRFGVICARMNLLGEARKALGEAVIMEPGNARYNLAMGTVASFGHDPLASLPYLEKFHALKPEDPVGTLAIGSAYFRAKDYDHALPWLKKSADHPRTAARSLYYLGRIARDKNQLDEALGDLARADKLEPNQPEVMAEIGQIFVEKKQYAAAQKELDAALALDKNNYAANFGLLQLYARTHDARLAEQSKRFQAVKNERAQESREMMRVIEIAPNGQKKPDAKP